MSAPSSLYHSMGKKSSKRTLEEADAAAPTSDAPAAPIEAMDVDVAASGTPKAKKSKKDKKDKEDEPEVALESLAPIAKPLAVKKTGKHVLKLVKKGTSTLWCSFHCLNTGTDLVLLGGSSAFFALWLRSIQITAPQARSQGSCQIYAQGRKGVRSGRCLLREFG